MNVAAEGEPSENPREDQGSGLSGDYESLAIDAVSGNSAERRDEEDRKLTGKTDASQQEGRVRHAVDEPRLGYRLHPCADERDQLSAEE
jgi:hypothetical protein